MYLIFYRILIYYFSSLLTPAFVIPVPLATIRKVQDQKRPNLI